MRRVGPLHASSIPAFLEGGLVKTPKMGRVGFPLRQRLEMAVAWTFPISLRALPIAFLSTSIPGLLAGLAWTHSLALFAAFPLCESWLRDCRDEKSHVGIVFFDFGERRALLRHRLRPFLAMWR